MKPVSIFFKCILAGWLWIFLTNAYGQNVVNEYTHLECSHSKQVSVPLFEKQKGNAANMPQSENQLVFYEHRDQFSYWYKLTVTEERIIDCKITPINTSDSYVLYVYKYNKEDFCNKVFYGKMKPLKASDFYKNKEYDSEAFELSEVKLKVKKGEVYYLCVLNVSPSNCGHNMRIADGMDTLTVKAVHYPCNETEEEKPVAKKEEPKKKENKVASAPKVKLDTIIVNTREVSEKSKKIDAELKIKDELSGVEITLTPIGKNTYQTAIEKGRSYNVECFSPGYKNFDYSIVISEYVNPDSGIFDVFLKPLKVGDNFVMNNIYFHPNTYALRKDSEKELNYLLNYLIEHPGVKIELQGHTNGSNRCKRNKAYKSKGPEWNFSGSAKKLSHYRAEAIKKYLVKKGVPKQNIVTRGYGGERMIIENPKTLEAIEKNIRVEVVILKDSGL